MEVLIGIVLIVGAIAYGIYTFKASGRKVLEISYMQQTSIKDANEIVSSMSDLDYNYRHYVELKGVIESVEPVKAPFSERNVAYYENHCYSVTQETHVKRDEDGDTHTYTTKRENEISNEKSPVQVYITDKSCDTKVYVDVNSFGNKAELMPACNRFESKTSPWLRNNSINFSISFSNTFRGGSELLGYRFEEKILLPKQPIYVLGELYKLGDVLYIGRATLAKKKPSLLSYKSEDEIISDAKRKRVITIALCGVAFLIGAFLIISAF